MISLDRKAPAIVTHQPQFWQTKETRIEPRDAITARSLGNMSSSPVPMMEMTERAMATTRVLPPAERLNASEHNSGADYIQNCDPASKRSHERAH
jgi:hypothetical protein